MPIDVDIFGYTLIPFYGSVPGTMSVRYWFEAYPGQTGDSRQFTTHGVTKTYIIDRRYDQDGIEHLNQKIINGFTADGRDYSETESGPGSSSPMMFQHFYYSRYKFDLHFDMGGGPAIPSVRAIMYDQPLADIFNGIDTNITWDGKSFTGWYKDPDRIMAFDHNTARMPAHTDLTVFAGWSERMHKVSFFDGMDRLVAVKYVSHGDIVRVDDIEFDGVSYEIGKYALGRGNFAGWYFYPMPSVFILFPFDYPVLNDLSLHAIWRGEHYTVTYHVGEAGAGSVPPIDTNLYSYGMIARAYKGNMIPPMIDVEFAGWRSLNGIIHVKPGDFFHVNGNIELFPFFEKTQRNYYLIFNGNNGVNAYNLDEYKIAAAQSATYDLINVEPKGDDMFKRSGYMFDGWSTLPNDFGKRVTSVEMGPSDLTLYALWLQAPAVNLIYFGNGGFHGNTEATYYASVPMNSKVDLARTLRENGVSFKMPGQVFAGWTTVMNDASTLATEIDIAYSNRIVFALWQPAERVNIVFVGVRGLNKGRKAEVNVPVPVNSRQTLQYVEPSGDAMFKLDGYIFDGWAEAAGDVSTRVRTIDIGVNDVYVYALWRPAPKTIVGFYGNGGLNGSWQAMYYAGVPMNSSQKLMDIQPSGDDMFKRNGYAFVGWTTTFNDVATLTLEIEIAESSVILYAYWVQTG
jgi:uncharacterized repeat protein (TIGR02543 family)